MEDSVNFSSDHEESGWTMYLEDFYSNTNHNHHNDNDISENCSSFSSLVSDAASLVMNKSDCNEKINYIHNHNNRRLSLMKKRKTRGADDDALEDTATSPVNSPKVYDVMDQFNKSTKQKDHSFNISEVEKGKEISSSRNSEEDNESLIIGRESESSELKKRGLCLVPLSIAANYFG